jgi:transcriptional regulator with XRE-family HTH domain
MVSEEMIGRRIKQLRLERGMTQELLASTAGLTKGYLSKIENSRHSPPVSTLISLSRALGVSIDAIFSEEELVTDYTVVRRADRQAVARKGSSFGYSYEPLALHFPNRHMDPYVLTVPAGTKESVEFSHRGEELLYVLKGRLAFHVGDDEIRLEEGDCLYFNSSVRHSGRSIDGGELQFLVVLWTPEEKRDQSP